MDYIVKPNGGYELIFTNEELVAAKENPEILTKLMDMHRTALEYREKARSETIATMTNAVASAASVIIPAIFNGVSNPDGINQ